MVGFKAKRKAGMLSVRAKLSSDEVIQDWQLEVISRKSIQGCLKAKLRKKNQIEYAGPDGIALYEYLRRPMEKYDFFHMVVQIINVYQAVEDYNLFPNNLIWDFREVYVDTSTKTFYFIYLPILSNHAKEDMLGFLQAVSFTTKVPVETDYSFIQRFSSFIKNLSEYDSSAIKHYISREDPNLAKIIRNNGRRQSGFLTNKPGEYYEHYRQQIADGNPGYFTENDNTALLYSQGNEAASLNNPSEATGLLKNQEEAEASPNDQEEGTGLLYNQGEGTGLLYEQSPYWSQGYAGNSNAPAVHFASLKRVSTNETVYVNKPVFRIGKEKSYVDYFVADNNAVSRSHADIINRNGQYFIYDHNSQNHTYVNGKMIPIYSETAIADGDELRLANETFIFYI